MEGLTAAISALGIAFSALKVTDFLKFITQQKWIAVLTQLIIWVVGFLFVMVVAKSDISGVFGIELANAKLATLVLVGMGVGSTASVSFDFKKAVDNSESATTGTLGGPTGPGDPPIS